MYDVPVSAPAGEGLGAGGQDAEPDGHGLGGAEVLVDQLVVAVVQTFLNGA
jgi:hypothetical protein